jgi:hypothetical protein
MDVDERDAHGQDDDDHDGGDHPPPCPVLTWGPLLGHGSSMNLLSGGPRR